MSALRRIMILASMATLAGCTVPDPVPVPLPSRVSGIPSPCESLSLAAFPQQDPPSKRTYYVCKPGVYAANYDPVRKTSQWSVQRVLASDSDPASGPAARTDKNDARPDPDIHDSLTAQIDDYQDNGYAIGYLTAPSSFPYDDIRYSKAQYLTNAFPLHPDLVQTWDSLNNLVLDLARQRGEVKVISGTIYKDGKGRGWVGVGDNETGNEGKVEVPTSIYKVIVDPKTGEYIAFVVSNEPITPGVSPVAIATWKDIEQLTDLVLAPDSPKPWKAIQQLPPNPQTWRPGAR